MRAPLDRAGWPLWVHVGVDVLDQHLIPAVESPGHPGIAPDALADVLGALLADGRCCGLARWPRTPPVAAASSGGM